jgi:hypothetical protein
MPPLNAGPPLAQRASEGAPPEGRAASSATSVSFGREL